jgi:ribonuclease M5
MNSVIVVEGIHDEMKIKSVYPDANVVITNGSEISQITLDLIKKLSETNEIIIFTDPDSPGEAIRKRITEVVPNAKQAFLRKKDAISKNKKKVGIEHATKETIMDSLENVYTFTESNNNITMADLFNLGLNGSANSQMLRDKISEHLNIGKPNAKTFLKRINLIQISFEELKELCQKLEM